jgi:succinate dehydrogenase / fumarate reductase cytochrome b subunit
MSPLRSVLLGSAQYRGREGQIAFLLHRLSGLATLLFLGLHILDTSFVFLSPALYQEVLNLYRAPLFMLGEILLVAAVIYHGVNGLRIALFDLFPRFWQPGYEKPAVYGALAAALLLWLPAAVIMGRNLIGFAFLGWK